MTTIGGGRDTILLNQSSKIAVDSRGFIYATVFAWTQVAVYDSTGKSVHLLSRPGQGPGELTRAELLSVGPGDTLYVVDNRAARISIFGPDFGYVRTVALASASQVRAFVPFADGGMVYSRNVLLPETAGLPLHYVSPTGRVIKSFGIENPVMGEREMSTVAYRHVARTWDGRSVWHSSFSEYRPEQWTLDGEKQASFFRDMRPWLVAEGRADTTTGQLGFAVSGLDVDSVGLLWVLVSVQMKNPPPLIKPDTTRGHTSKRPIVQPRRSDSMVEVIDPGSARILASRVPAQFFAGSAGAGVLYTRNFDENGVVSFELWRAQLIGR